MKRIHNYKPSSISYYGVLCKFNLRVYDIWVIKILPFVLIPVLILAALGYWRFVYVPKSALTTQTQQIPSEVPKSLPASGDDDKLTTLEQSVKSLVGEVDKLKSAKDAPNSDTRITNVESVIVELKARLSALERATPVPASTTTSSSKSAVYIPLGSTGQINSSTDWISLGTFQATVDTSSFPGYTSMQLEVNMRLNQPGGTLYARLYSGGSIDSSQVSSTSTSSNLLTSGNFTLSGSKTYTLQAKSSEGIQAFIDNARIRVNF